MFDISNVPLSTSRGLLNKGYYNFAIAKCVYKQSSSTGSKFFAFELSCVDEGHKGQKLFYNIVMEHSNDVVVKLGKQNLADLMFAIGVMSFTDIHKFASSITGKEFKALVDVNKDKTSQKEFNIVRNVFSKQGVHRNSSLSIGATLATNSPEDDLPF